MSGPERSWWGSRQASSINHRDADELHRHIGIEKGHEVEANRTLALIRKMYNWARTNGYVERKEKVTGGGIVLPTVNV